MVDRIKALRISMISASFALIGIYFAAALFIGFFPSLKTTILIFTVSYLLYAAGRHWNKMLRKMGSSFISFGVLLILIAPFFFAMAQNEDTLFDSYVTEAIARGVYQSGSANATFFELTTMLSHCTDASTTDLCAAKAYEQRRLGNSLGNLVVESLNEYPQPIPSMIEDERYQENVADLFDFHNIGLQNRGLGWLLVLVGAVLLCFAYFIEHNWQRILQSASSALFFPSVASFIIFKIIEFVFLLLPTDVGLTQQLIANVAGKAALASIAWMFVTGVIWVVVNLVLIGLNYEKIRAQKEQRKAQSEEQDKIEEKKE